MRSSVRPTPAGRPFPASFAAAPALLVESLRPRQWIKNGFVLTPVLFAREAGDPGRLAAAFGAALVFSALSGAAYLLNDVVDRDADRLHPGKRNRPVASGRLGTGPALGAAAALAAASLGLAFALVPSGAAFAAAGFAALQALYSLGLKRLVFLDAMSIAAGFVLRVVAGGFAAEVVVSHWIVLCTFLLALFLGLSKRREELTTLEEGDRDRHRPVLGEYSRELLDQANVVVLGATIVCYALWTVSPESVAKFGSDRLVWTVPFVVYGLLRYLYLVHRGEAAGSPTDALLRDRPLLLCVALWLAVSSAIVYLG